MRYYFLYAMMVWLVSTTPRTDRCLQLALECEACVTDQECWDCVMGKAKRAGIQCEDLQDIIEDLTPNDETTPQVQL